MKKIVYAFLIVCLSFSFVACGDDDKNIKSQTEIVQLTTEYANVCLKINNLKAEISSLSEDAKNLSGGRFQIIQEEINNKMILLQKYQIRKTELERELGIS